MFSMRVKLNIKSDERGEQQCVESLECILEKMLSGLLLDGPGTLDALRAANGSPPDMPVDKPSDVVTSLDAWREARGEDKDSKKGDKKAA